MRTSRGCWTCRLRRKKCDEVHPVCTVCASLNITCHFDHVKPSWMDGGAQQDAMAHQIKLEIKDMRRRNRRAGNKTSPTDIFPSDASTEPSWSAPVDDIGDSLSTVSISQFTPPESQSSITTGRPASPRPLPWDAIQTTFYLDHLFGFLYPFYQPYPRRGGRAWILELLSTSAVFQLIASHQSHYFYKLVWPDAPGLGEGTRTNDPFSMLSQALQTLFSADDLVRHSRCASRVLTSIVQIYRYEISISNFGNWKIHLNAALTLFIQLCNACENESGEDSSANSFNIIFANLEMPELSSSVGCTTQESFIFSTGLLLFDDIISAAALAQEPQLYRHHQDLLGGDSPIIELETIIGVKSSILKSLGEVISMAAKKEQDEAAGNLNGMALAQRASKIMESLTANLRELKDSSNSLSTASSESIDVLEQFRKPYGSLCSSRDTCLVSRLWTHATIIYLITIVSGWQPANSELRYHTDQIIQKMQSDEVVPLLRTMVWPLYVAACFADPHQTRSLRDIFSMLQPTIAFPTVHKALELAQWKREQNEGCRSGNRLGLGLSSGFQSQDELPLLI